MNLQIATIVKRAPSPFAVYFDTRLEMQTVANVQSPTSVILIQIALQLSTTLCQQHIYRHRLRFLHRLRNDDSFITHLVLRPVHHQRNLLPLHQQPSKYNKTKGNSNRLPMLMLPQQQSHYNHRHKYRQQQPPHSDMVTNNDSNHQTDG